ncbi:TPA: bifunctional diguanylate cyclase/phosphodiesterase [Legionella anisa]
MINMEKHNHIDKQLTEVAAERDSLIPKIKEYEEILKLKPDSVIQYIDKIKVPFYQFSLDLKITYINQATVELLNCSRENICQDKNLWFSYVHEEDKANVIESLLQMVNEGKNELMLEYRIKKRDETILFISDRATLITDKEGHPACIMGFLTDITRLISSRREILLYDQILNIARTEKSIEIAIEAILKISCLSFEWDEGEVWLGENSGEKLYCIKIWHKLHDEVKEFYEKSYQLKIPVNEGFQGEVIRSSLPTLINDFGINKQFIRGDLISKAGLKTAFGLKISYQGKTLGVLIYFSKKVKKLSHEQIQALQRIAEILGDLIQTKISKEEMSYMIYHDKLTGLTNRLGLETSLEDQIIKNKREIIALIMFDLDRFSTIKESMGFEFSDLIIRNVATKLDMYLCDVVNLITNIGGDQFAIVLNNINRPEEIAPVIEKINSILKTPFLIEDKQIIITISIGVAIYPYDAINHISLLKNAMISLGHAKSRGGDCVQYFSETLQKAVTNSINIENDLRKALTENDLRLYYQPQVDLKSRNIIGVEALLRWQMPDGELRLPSSFLSIAEQSDLIVYIGKWVLLEIANDFPFAQLNIPVSFNLSARQLLIQYEIEEFIEVLLQKLSLPPSMLEVEVTESQLMIDPVRSTKVMSSLQSLGLSIAIDDFGTGYSSFDYLKRFRPNKIKIDKSFIDKLPSSREDAGIVRAIIALCKCLNIKVIAEGVEHAHQLQFLIDEECDEIQGFYFSKPLPIYDLRNLIDDKVKLILPNRIK